MTSSKIFINLPLMIGKMGTDKKLLGKQKKI